MYSDYYGFSEQPFQLTPDARFWFESRTHKKAMAYLGYGLAQAEGFVVITGEIGAGKTTLAGHVLAMIDRARLNAIEIVSTQVEGDDMLRLIAQGLGLATQGTSKAALLDQIEARMEEEFGAGKRTLVVVDEAQNLPGSALEELRMLSNFHLGGRAFVQIVLLAQPEFRDRLSQPDLEQLRQRVIASHHLGAMDADEVEAYVQHRLRTVGWTGRPSFDPEVFAALHRHSGGVPRRLNQIANRLMLYAALEQLERIDADALDAVAEELGTSAPAPAAEPSEEKVLPLRARRAEAQPPAPALAPLDERRLAALEAKLVEQEASLRRVLNLMLDWLEGEGDARRAGAA